MKTKSLKEVGKKKEAAILRPYNRYNIYFTLERENTILSKGGTTSWSTGVVRGTPTPGYEDLAIPPLPPRFAHLAPPPGWCMPRTNKVRRHRKTHGVASFSEIAKTIAASWKTVDNHETLRWCTEVEKVSCEVSFLKTGPLIVMKISACFSVNVLQILKQRYIELKNAKEAASAYVVQPTSGDANDEVAHASNEIKRTGEVLMSMAGAYPGVKPMSSDEHEKVAHASFHIKQTEEDLTNKARVNLLPHAARSEEAPGKTPKGIVAQGSATWVSASPGANYNYLNLPLGWSLATDSESGRVYYYHRASGTTTWGRPTQSSVPSDCVPRGSRIAAHGNIGGVCIENCGVLPRTSTDPFDDDPSAKEALSNLPKGWESTVDPKSGRIYYYHGVSRVSSWKRPEPLVSSADHNDGDEEKGFHAPETHRDGRLSPFFGMDEDAHVNLPDDEIKKMWQDLDEPLLNSKDENTRVNSQSEELRKLWLSLP